MSAPSHGQILALAWPIILANISVPLLGLADVAIIGHHGDVVDLGAIALGALVFNFVYWGFGFLRMSTTGFIAQAAGAQLEIEIRAIWLRALLLAVTLGISLILLQELIAVLALNALQAGAAVEDIAADYIGMRIWGAPASLALYTCLGVLIGLGKSKQVLVLQVVLNGLNIVLDLLFAGVMGWGASGIALGTAMAEWLSLGLALYLVIHCLNQRSDKPLSWWPKQQLLLRHKWAALFSANSDILLRTLFLLFSFAWFTNAGARFGDDYLAANHILLQLIAFAAFFLDGYAHVAESLIGRAIGANRAMDFDLAVKRGSHIAVITCVLLSVSLYLGGPWVITNLTEHTHIQQLCQQFLPFSLLYILLSCAAFQLDGIFIGATRTTQMRNASALSSLLFIALSYVFIDAWGNAGLWSAFIIYVVLRGVFLMLYYPALRQSLNQNDAMLN